MSDITYARKCDDLMDVDTETVPERLQLAQVAATQAVARASREIDAKLKYVADRIVAAMPSYERPEQWITWGEAGRRMAVSVAQVESFTEVGDETVLNLLNGEAVEVPISYGTVAMMVGA
jgi:hypothetical protein